MTNQLIILRHGKSDWGSGASNDFERPLSDRGHRQARRLGEWMFEKSFVTGSIISSAAMRARQTAEHICNGLGIETDTISLRQDLYLADLDTLLETANDAFSSSNNVTIVGHNPGLEELLVYLCGKDLPLSSNGKLLATSNLAQIVVPDKESGLKRHSCELVRLNRPADIT